MRKNSKITTFLPIQIEEEINGVKFKGSIYDTEKSGFIIEVHPASGEKMPKDLYKVMINDLVEEYFKSNYDKKHRTI